MEKKKTRRRRDIFKEPLDEPRTDERGRTKQTFLKGEISWRDGHNIFSGPEARGYEVWISPVTEEQFEVDGHKITSTGFTIGGPGLRKLICPAERFNAKTLETLAVGQEELDALKLRVVEDWKRERVKHGS